VTGWLTKTRQYNSLTRRTRRQISRKCKSRKI